MRIFSSAVGLVLVLTIGSARSRDLKPAEACTRLSDDASRLACYDAALGYSKSSAAHSSGAAKTAPLAKFGDNGLLHPEPKADMPKSMTAQVRLATSLAYGLFQLTLDNGQEWRTTQGDSALAFKANDMVTISRRVLGGYEISLAGRNASVNATRIR
jgi:hypothetical protein